MQPYTIHLQTYMPVECWSFMQVTRASRPLIWDVEAAADPDDSEAGAEDDSAARLGHKVSGHDSEVCLDASLAADCIALHIALLSTA